MNREIAKLSWSCRRGMLELDLILHPFLIQQYPQLSPKQQHDFHRLLDCPDQEIYDCLVTKRKVAEPTLVEISELIIQYTRRH